MSTQCPVCGEFAVGHEKEIVHANRKGKDVSYESHFLECHSCEFVFVTDAQMRQNNRALVAAESLADGLPTSDEIKDWRHRHNLTQKEAGKLLGVGPTAFSKYENYDLRPSGPTERLLHVMLNVEAAFQSLARKTNISSKAKSKAKTTHYAGVIVNTELKSGLINARERMALAVAHATTRVDAHAYALSSVKINRRQYTSISQHEITF